MAKTPNFLVLGAARTGTTKLHAIMRAHPEIYVPKAKTPEPHFFLKEKEYRKGLDYYKKKYFHEACGFEAVGEISTSYLFQPWVSSRIKKHLPHVRLIVLARNPADRAFSGYLFTRANGLENKSFSEAIRSEQVRADSLRGTRMFEIAPYSYLGRSMYMKQIRNYLKHFKKDSIGFFVYEELFLGHNRLGQWESLFEFLRVADVSKSIDFNSKINTCTGNERISNEDRCFIAEVVRDDVAELSEFAQKDLSSLWGMK